MSRKRRGGYIGSREAERYCRQVAKERAREERERDEQKEEAEAEKPKRGRSADHYTDGIPGGTILSDGE